MLRSLAFARFALAGDAVRAKLLARTGLVPLCAPSHWPTVAPTLPRERSAQRHYGRHRPHLIHASANRHRHRAPDARACRWERGSAPMAGVHFAVWSGGVGGKLGHAARASSHTGPHWRRTASRGRFPGPPSNRRNPLPRARPETSLPRLDSQPDPLAVRGTARTQPAREGR